MRSEGSTAAESAEVTISQAVEFAKRHSTRPTANVKSTISEFLRRYRRQDSRALDLVSLDQVIQGAQDEIFVNRDGLLKSANEEFVDTELDPRVTLVVNYHGEVAGDYGGPRKEFLQQYLHDLCAMLVDEKSRKLIENDTYLRNREYYCLGMVMGYCMYQHGPVPAIMNLSDLTTDNVYHAQLIEGLRKTGLYQLAVAVPSVMKWLSEAYIPEAIKVNNFLKMFTTMYSESNIHSRAQRHVYSQYVQYCRQAYKGARVSGNCSLEQILRFVTGMMWEPIFGYSLTPSIHFSVKNSKEDMFPTSSTCANILYLPYSLTTTIGDDELYNKMDLAFMNSYFGLA